MFLDYEDILNEDTDIFNEEENWYENDMVFCENCDGLFQISAESEASWSNIMMESMQAEHKAIMNEDTDLLNESASETMQKIIDWIKEKARKLAAFFRQLIQRLTVQFTNTDKFYAKYRNSYSKTIKGKVKIYSWKKSDLNSIIVFCNKELNTLTGFSGQSTEELVAFSKEHSAAKVIEACRSNERSENNSISPDTAMANIAGAKKKISFFKEQEAKHQKHLKSMLKDCKEAEVSKNKNKYIFVQNKKKISSNFDSVTGASITVVTGLVADSLTVARMAIKENKKPA